MQKRLEPRREVQVAEEMVKVLELTTEQALREAISMWRWLEETGSAIKKAWPGWKRWDFGGGLWALHDCPLCTYARYVALPSGGGDPCNFCPCGAWRGESYGCEAVGSPYRDWQVCGTVEARKRHAAEVVAVLLWALRCNGPRGHR